jgi:hypothetical protein
LTLMQVTLPSYHQAMSYAGSAREGSCRPNHGLEDDMGHHVDFAIILKIFPRFLGLSPFHII